MVPGIANSSDTKYIRTFAGYALSLGFRVAVLNHLGAKVNLKLTAPRIFTYGMFMICSFPELVSNLYSTEPTVS